MLSRSFLVFIWKSRLVRITIILYLLHAFSQTMYDELYSMWAIQSIQDGGIAFDNSKIGLVRSQMNSLLVMHARLTYLILNDRQ